MAHSTRFKACFEKSDEKRKSLFEEAYRMYEGVLLASCHSSIIHMLSDIRRDPKKSVLFQPIPDFDVIDPNWRRMMSHSFAGMALCSLFGSSDHKR